jgi:hypothetical protein
MSGILRGVSVGAGNVSVVSGAGLNGDKDGAGSCSPESVGKPDKGEVVGRICPQASRTAFRVTIPAPAAAILRKSRLEYLPIIILLFKIREFYPEIMKISF